MFLITEYDYEKNNLIIKRKARGKNSQDIYLATQLFTDCEIIGENEFEIDKKDSGRFTSSIPEIKNIGTVKPNSMLSKIEEATKENEDIILPTMGLTDNDKVDVPIVSENYIN